MSAKPKILEGDGDPRHGTQNGYNNLHCRCEECKAAHRLYYTQGAGAEAKWRYRDRLISEGLTTRDRTPRKRRCAPRTTSTRNAQ